MNSVITWYESTVMGDQFRPWHVHVSTLLGTSGDFADKDLFHRARASLNFWSLSINQHLYSRAATFTIDDIIYQRQILWRIERFVCCRTIRKPAKEMWYDQKTRENNLVRDQNPAKIISYEQKVTVESFSFFVCFLVHFHFSNSIQHFEVTCITCQVSCYNTVTIMQSIRTCSIRTRSLIS